MGYRLHIVTGAPGAGKSTALTAFLRLRSNYIAFDIDWLIAAGSELAGEDIHVTHSTWRPYNHLWCEVLHSVHRNGRVPVLFAPWDERDMRETSLPAWCERVEWLLLDCDDETRRERLRQRPGWTAERLQEALEDASYLRGNASFRLDTAVMPADEVSRRILEWLDQTQQIREGASGRP